VSGSEPPALLPEDWPLNTVVKIRVNGVRGDLAAQTISFAAQMLEDREWLVATCETRETWLILRLPEGRLADGRQLPAEADRAALEDLMATLHAFRTASVKAKRSFVVIFDDEEIGSIGGGDLSHELQRDLLGPWQRNVGL